MKWHDLIAKVEILESGGAPAADAVDITHDSRRVTAGTVYVAIPGLKVHGDTFIADAVGRGAVAVVSENAQPGCGVAWVRVADARAVLGPLARHLWHIRFEDLVSVGVTGTNGKTTVAHLVHHLFTLEHGVENAWMFGTIAYRIGSRRKDAPTTTPEASDIFRLMGQAASMPRSLVMEVSSHALTLHRISGFEYDVVVFTNLTQDHLDFHQDMEDYYRAKKRLFTHYLKAAGTAVINIDDPWGRRLAEELKGRRQITFGCAPDAQVRIMKSECSWDGTTVELRAEGAPVTFQSTLCGLFNVYNLVALWAGARALGKDCEQIRTSIESAPGVRGRMQRVKLPTDYTVVVDYAHTPDALEKVLAAARPLTRGKLVCVFGCGGDRDRGKRPRMAAAVAKNCDEAVVTSDNPRSEEPSKIIDEILTGMPLDFPHHVVADRREGIRRALLAARKGDCIVVAGKGHETYQEIHGVRHHFDDVEVIEKIHAEFQGTAVNV